MAMCLAVAAEGAPEGRSMRERSEVPERFKSTDPPGVEAIRYYCPHPISSYRASSSAVGKLNEAISAASGLRRAMAGAKPAAGKKAGRKVRQRQAAQSCKTGQHWITIATSQIAAPPARFNAFARHAFTICAPLHLASRNSVSGFRKLTLQRPP